MLIEFSADQGFVRLARTVGQGLQDAANEAVKNTTEQVKGRSKAEVESGLTSKVASTVTAEVYLNDDGSVGGYVHSRWFRRRRTSVDIAKGYAGKVLGSANSDEIAGGGRPLGANDVLFAYTTGATIRAAEGYLYVDFRSRGAKRKTRLNFRDRDISLVPLRAEDGYLIIDRRDASARRVTTDKKGRRRGKVREVGTPIGLLLRETQVPKRLDFAPVVEFGEKRLPEQLTLSLDRRGLLD